MIAAKRPCTEDNPSFQEPELKKFRTHEGGSTFTVTDVSRLQRFLILGCEGGSYYQGESELAVENASAAGFLIESGRGKEVLDIVRDISLSGRAHKQDPALFVLAMLAKLADPETKRAAYESLAQIARIPTHLFTFLTFAEELSKGKGWGRAHRRAVGEWYLGKDPQRLAFLATKFAQRGGWSHRDVLRLCHAKPSSPDMEALFKFIVRKELVDGDSSGVVDFLRGVEACKASEDPAEVIALIKKHGLVREHIPTELLGDVEVWRSLLPGMPMTAMFRNLGKMSAIGLLDSGSAEAALVCSRLVDAAALKKARIHPIAALIALRTYSRGQGIKGKLAWDVNADIVDALDKSFYLCFDSVVPTGKRYLHAIDVSGSMDFYQCAGAEALSPRDVACALTMVTARTEGLDNNEFMAFCDEALPVDPAKTEGSLNDFIAYCQDLRFGGTYCQLPMEYALEKRMDVDVFVVYTDCETSYSGQTPAEALKRYRAEMDKPEARLVVIATTASKFTLADPEDPGMLDVAGFDPAVPTLVSEFAMGQV